MQWSYFVNLRTAWEKWISHGLIVFSGFRKTNTAGEELILVNNFCSYFSIHKYQNMFCQLGNTNQFICTLCFSWWTPMPEADDALVVPRPQSGVAPQHEH